MQLVGHMPDSSVNPAVEANLREEMEELRRKFAATESPAPASWRLTAVEERVFSVLLAVDTATRDAVSVVMGRDLGRTVDVHISRIRKKVTSHGVEIESVRGKGWRLVGREAWRRALAVKSTKGD